jgi:mannose/fructose/N-acetylgalactosamine-specific phosphotransferase system component IIC
MKANVLFVVLGFVFYFVLNRVFGIDNLLLEAGIVSAVAAVIYVGLKLVERSKRQKS